MTESDLPAPLIAAGAPSTSRRCSTSVHSVQSTDELTVSVPSLGLSITVSEATST